MTGQRRVGRPRQCPDEVRDIVIRLRLDGLSLRQIAQRMNADGYRTRGAEPPGATKRSMDSLQPDMSPNSLYSEIEQRSCYRKTGNRPGSFKLAGRPISALCAFPEQSVESTIRRRTSVGRTARAGVSTTAAVRGRCPGRCGRRG